MLRKLLDPVGVLLSVWCPISQLPAPVLAAKPPSIKNEDLGPVVKLVLMKPVDPDFLVRYVHGVNGCIRDQLPGGIDFAVRNR